MKKNSISTKDIVHVSLFAAITCILAPNSIPLAGGVPISLASLVAMLAGVMLGKKKGALSILIYVLIGAIGLPVFSGYKAGVSVLFGVTGGFILGFIPLAYISGYFSELADTKDKPIIYQIIGMLIGTIVLYLIGMIWFEIVMKLPFLSALMDCVIPFLPGDLLKIGIVALFSTKKHTFIK